MSALFDRIQLGHHFIKTINSSINRQAINMASYNLHLFDFQMAFSRIAPCTQHNDQNQHSRAVKWILHNEIACLFCLTAEYFRFKFVEKLTTDAYLLRSCEKWKQKSFQFNVKCYQHENDFVVIFSIFKSHFAKNERQFKCQRSR